MILGSLKVLEESGKNDFFVWVPGHCGVPGNELAGRAARQVKRRINHSICSAWQNSWDGLSTQLTEIKFVQPRFSEEYESRKKSKSNYPPLCHSCEAALVVGHLLCECPMLTSRWRTFDLPDDLKICVNDLHSIERVLSYFRVVGIYWKL
nr:unnamed protein product [Callosobruchus analis]